MKKQNQSVAVQRKHTKEYRLYGKIAEWMVVREGKTLQEVCDSPRIGVSLQTLQQWSIKHNWQEKKDKYMNKPVSVGTMVYDLAYSELADAIQRQMNGEKLSVNDILKLEKLVKMFKQTGLPFPEQVLNVMKVFLYYVKDKTEKDSHDQMAYISFIREFMEGVDAGAIQAGDN